MDRINRGTHLKYIANYLLVGRGGGEGIPMYDFLEGYRVQLLTQVLKVGKVDNLIFSFSLMRN